MVGAQTLLLDYFADMEHPVLTVDIVIKTDDNRIVLIRRGKEPYKGSLAIPGGRVEVGETVENAAVREAKEETGLDVELVKLLGVYSEPGRDPRGHYVSIVYLARVLGGTPKALSDAAEIVLVSADAEGFRELDMAFDHKSVLDDALPMLEKL